MAMTGSHVIVADSRYVYTWQYRTAASAQSSAAGASGNKMGEGAAVRKTGGGRERVLDIQDPSPTPAQVRPGLLPACGPHTEAGRRPEQARRVC